MSEFFLEHAQETIDDIWRPDQGLPTSPSHPDTFMANLDVYVDTHLAMDNLDRALTEFELWKQSRYPSGFTPHYMLGSHPRASIETRWIDAVVQHTIKLENGERVSPLAGPPNWAIATLSIANYLEKNDRPNEAQKFVDDNFDLLVESSQALYDSRDDGDGLIVQIHKDELTIRDGVFSPTTLRTESTSIGNPEVKQSHISSQDKKRIDKTKNPKFYNIDNAVNATLAQNNASLVMIAEKYGKAIPERLMRDINTTTINGVFMLISRINRAKALNADNVLATARYTHAVGHENKTLRILTRLDALLGKDEDNLGPFEDIYSPILKIRPDLNLRIARLAIGDSETKPAVHEPSSFHIIGSNMIRLLEEAGGFPRVLDEKGKPIVNRSTLGRRVKGTQGFWTPTATEALLYAKLTSSHQNS